MNLHGVLRVHKPKDMTSHDVVAFLRRRLQTQEVGHAGTLDPMAEGLILALVGEGTKVSDYLLNGRKTYSAQVKFGLLTDSWDADGQILEETEVILDQNKVIQTALSLQGDFEWPVPIYSAVKKDGRKLYDYARSNAEVEIPKRKMQFDTIKVHSFSQNILHVDLSCSKGSFIRTWAYQLGQTLGCASTLVGLTRNRSEPYALNGAITLTELESMGPEEVEVHSAFVPLKKSLPQLQAFSLKGRDLGLLMNGQVPHDLQRRLIPYQREINTKSNPEFFRVLDGNSSELRAILELSACNPARIRRVLKRP